MDTGHAARAQVKKEAGIDIVNMEDFKSDLADHEDAGGSMGVKNELTKEDEEGLAKFLKNVQG